MESEGAKCREHAIPIDGREAILNIARQDNALPQVTSSAREAGSPRHTPVCCGVGSEFLLQELLQALEALLDRGVRDIQEAIFPFNDSRPRRFEVLGNVGGHVPGRGFGDTQGTGDISGVYVAWSHASKNPSSVVRTTLAPLP